MRATNLFFFAVFSMFSRLNSTRKNRFFEPQKTGEQTGKRIGKQTGQHVHEHTGKARLANRKTSDQSRPQKLKTEMVAR